MASLSFGMSPREQAAFYRESVEDGAQVENVTMDEYESRGGITLCTHDPQWGGVESKFAVCDRCDKRVLKRRDGRLRSHKGSFGWKCPGPEGGTADVRNRQWSVGRIRRDGEHK